MSYRAALTTFPAVLLAACAPTAPPAPVDQVYDIRIDGIEANASVDPDSSQLKMCVNNDGHIFVVWVDDRDGKPAVWFNRSIDNGASWYANPLRINRANAPVHSPAIACQDDNVYVVWVDSRDGETQKGQIYFSRSTDGGENWLATDVLLEDDKDGYTESLQPVIAAAGPFVHVAWTDDAFGARDVFVASSESFGQNWRRSKSIDVAPNEPRGDSASFTPAIAASAQGDVYVVWVDSRNTGGDIYFNRSDNGGMSWRIATKLDTGDVIPADGTGTTDSMHPVIAADGKHVYVAWADHRNGTNKDIYVNYSPTGGASWLPEDIRLDTDNPGFFNSIKPSIAVSKAKAHVVWQDNRYEGYDVYYRALDAGKPVGEEEFRVDRGDIEGHNNSENPVIAVGRDGRIAVAWEDYRGEAETGRNNGYTDLYYNFDLGSGFKEDDDLRIDAMLPGESWKTQLQVAVYGGWMYTAWVDGRSGTADIYFRAMEIGTETVVDPSTGIATVRAVE